MKSRTRAQGCPWIVIGRGSVASERIEYLLQVFIIASRVLNENSRMYDRHRKCREKEYVVLGASAIDRNSPNVKTTFDDEAVAAKILSTYYW